MKIAVFFPGIGYHCDKPLLYYSAKICSQYQYECIKIPYTNLSKSVVEAFKEALLQTEKYLENIRWDTYEEILFVSKSIGTITAAAYAQKHHICCRNVFYTPLAQTFDFNPQSGIAFHGTNDSWVETSIIKSKCRENHLPLYLTENANHSLEVTDTHKNLDILGKVMKMTEAYIANNMYYQAICADELCPRLFEHFIRRQNVVLCRRKENGNWVLKEDPFIDDWTEEDYQTLIACLKNTVATGGFVYGAFCANMLKGFVSVESELMGGEQKYLDLSSIHVSEDLRGKGVGKILFHAAKNWAKQHGAEKLYISAHSAAETQAFYKAMGCVDAQVIDPHHVEAEPFDCQLECLLSTK